jgi:hypothetical protein
MTDERKLHAIRAALDRIERDLRECNSNVNERLCSRELESCLPAIHEGWPV